MWLESGRFVEAAVEALGCTWAITPPQICAETAVIKTQNVADVPTRTFSGLVLLEEFVPRNRLFRDLR
jgi:hypothetical protein